MGKKEDHVWIREIREDARVRDLYLVKAKKMGLTKKGDPFLNLTLSDRSGEMEARVWERAEELGRLFKEGDIVEVEAVAGSYRGQIQLAVSELKAAGEDIDLSPFLEASPRDVGEMMGSLRDVLKTIKNPQLKALVDRFMADHQFLSLFKRAPAAKNFHHGYLGGLLEHTLSVCEMCTMVAEHYPELDRDVLLAGAFLHDIGKVRELGLERQVDYTDEGRLLGHLVLGVTMLEEKLALLKGFPEDAALRLKHLILSHHGEYEFGSPKRPKFLEAFALHLMDDLDAKIKGLSRFMEQDRQEGAWTEFHRLFDRYFLKRGVPPAEGRTESPPREEGPQKTLFSS